MSVKQGFNMEHFLRTAHFLCFYYIIHITFKVLFLLTIIDSEYLFCYIISIKNKDSTMKPNQHAFIAPISILQKAICLGWNHYGILLLNISLFTTCALFASATIFGVLAVPALILGFTKLSLKIARTDPVDFGCSLSFGFSDGRWYRSLELLVTSFVSTVLPLLIFGTLAQTTPFMESIQSPYSPLYHLRLILDNELFYYVFSVVLMMQMLSFIIMVSHVFFSHADDKIQTRSSQSIQHIYSQLNTGTATILFSFGMITAYLISLIPTLGPSLVFMTLPFLAMIPATIYTSNRCKGM